MFLFLEICVSTGSEYAENILLHFEVGISGACWKHLASFWNWNQWCVPLLGVRDHASVECWLDYKNSCYVVADILEKPITQKILIFTAKNVCGQDQSILKTSYLILKAKSVVRTTSRCTSVECWHDYKCSCYVVAEISAKLCTSPPKTFVFIEFYVLTGWKYPENILLRFEIGISGAYHFSVYETMQV